MEQKLKKTRLALATSLAIAFLAVPGFASGQTTAQTSTQSGSQTDTQPPAPATTKAVTKTAKNSKTAPKKSGKKDVVADTKGGAEPDKILYDRAMSDYKRGKYTEARLNLQTLINTYPDSEFLAKAKLAIGDSYYKEGGTSNLTQSVAEYKDFITFFPFLDEAAYAQMQVGMAHYRMMEKADRDNSHAESAEDEFQTFLLKFPNSPLVPKAEQHLREVQEILADGDFRVASYYYTKGPRSYRASLARLNEIIERYPLYSQSDRTLWMAGTIYEKAERRETADQLYARIVREYPSSKLVDPAKKKLTTAGVPIPQPDPVALARVNEDKKFASQRPGLVKRTTALIRTGPDVTGAAHSGQPNLQPPPEATSATDILRPGAPAPGGLGTGSPSGNSVAVETVPAGSADTGAADNTTSVPAGDSAPSNEGSLPAPMDATPGNNRPNGQPTTAPAPAPGDTTPSTAPADAPAGTPAPDAVATVGMQSGSSAPATTPAATANPNGTNDEPTASSAATSDPKSESTSKKKKKGVKKIIPW